MKIKTINPATEELIAEYDQMSEQQVMDSVEKSNSIHKEWKNTPLKEKAAILLKLAEKLRENKEEYAQIMTAEMGKSISSAIAEVEKCAWTAEVYAQNAEQWLAEEVVEADGLKHRVVYDPLGVILAIMPWNFPFWQAFRFIIPTLLAGNGALLKHASNVTGSALKIQEVCEKAGFPKGLFTTIIADHATVAKVIEHPFVQGVSLTGSTEAGKRIGEKAGALLKKVVLELGGSDAFIILEDADIDLAAKNAVLGRYQNCGQSCIAAKRFIVHESIKEKFADAFVKEANTLVVGDPQKKETTTGPLVDKKAAREMEEVVKDAVDKGAKVLLGGSSPQEKGAFFSPTIIINVNENMKVISQEVFGPIAPIISFKEDQEAIAMANNSEFGLGGSVWTKDLKRGEKIARQIESGAAFVNSITKSDPRMPFGGIKDSGLGRELSHWGLKEFVNIKAVSVYEHK